MTSFSSSLPSYIYTHVHTYTYTHTTASSFRSALVIFKHGSVVFFNVDDHTQSKYLHSLTRHCGEVVPQSHRFRETLECRLKPHQEKYHEMGPDIVNLRELNEDSVKVVAGRCVCVLCACV